MRIASGVTNKYLYFMAVDATDFQTPETGLSAFTVYRSRNGGTATVFTTPTIVELSSSNMPGLYALLLDEDMTIDSGHDNQEMAFRITCSGMAPVTRTIELYRAKITIGETLTVSSGAASADATKISGSSTAADRLETSVLSILPGTVNDANTSPTTTVFAADNITEATADHFIGRSIIFTSGALQYQATTITDYALASGEGRFTVEALTEAPADGDTFIIV